MIKYSNEQAYYIPTRSKTNPLRGQDTDIEELIEE